MGEYQSKEHKFDGLTAMPDSPAEVFHRIKRHTSTNNIDLSQRKKRQDKRAEALIERNGRHSDSQLPDAIKPHDS